MAGPGQRREGGGTLLPVPEAPGICLQAKLPRGIHQVRPHLQHIDNVPLLVPLFTDCTPESEYCGHGDSDSLAPSTEHCQGLASPGLWRRHWFPMQGAKEPGLGGAGEPGGLESWACALWGVRSDWVGWSQRGAHFPVSPVLWMSVQRPVSGSACLILKPRTLSPQPCVR